MSRTALTIRTASSQAVCAALGCPREISSTLSPAPATEPSSEMGITP